MFVVVVVVCWGWPGDPARIPHTAMTGGGRGTPARIPHTAMTGGGRGPPRVSLQWEIESLYFRSRWGPTSYRPVQVLLLLTNTSWQKKKKKQAPTFDGCHFLKSCQNQLKLTW